MKIITIFRVLLIILSLFIVTKRLYANGSNIQKISDTVYVVTEIVNVENITPEKATEIAIQNACTKAIEQYCGIEISGRISSIQAINQDSIHIDHFSKMIKQTTKGIIINKEILDDKIIIEDKVIKKILTLKIKVGKQIGSKDYNFNIDAGLNSEYYKEGELLELWISSTIGCYITVLNVTSDGNVITLYPNKFHTENYLNANEKLLFPNDSDKLIGIELKVNLLPKHDEDTEIIKIIATKKPINININSNYKKAIDYLYNFLVDIPRDEIEELDLVYYIYK